MSKRTLTAAFSLAARRVPLVGVCSSGTADSSPSASALGDSFEQLVGPRLTQQVGDVTHAYHRFGSGDQTVIMIMGYTGTMTMWTTGLLGPLAKNFDVIIFDNQGIGASVDNGNRPLTIREMASNTVGLFEALGVRNPNLFGWSMGGIIALTITAEYGDKINKVVSVAGNTGSPLAKSPTADVVSKLTDPSNHVNGINELSFGTDEVGNAARSRWLAELAATLQVDRQLSTFARQLAAQIAFKSNGIPVAKLKAIHNQVLIVHGMDDVINPVENAALLADTIPGSWLARYPGAGHGVLFQDSDNVSALATVFYQSS